MNGVFDYLNANQGAIMALLTAVYVLATLVTTWMIHRSNRLTRESNSLGREALEQSLRFERERNRPYVIFDFVFEESFLHAVLQNIGSTPAIELAVSIEGDLKRGQREGPLPFTRRPIAFMAPGRSIKDLINTDHEFYKDHPEPVYEIRLKYQSTDGRQFEETVIIELEHQKGLSHIVPKDYVKEVASELKTVGKHLKELTEKTDQLAWTHNSLVERPTIQNATDVESFDEAEFLQSQFARSNFFQRRIYMNLLSYRNSEEAEQARSKVLHCERQGLLRRERNYFLLTEAGHAVLREAESPNTGEVGGEAGVATDASISQDAIRSRGGGGDYQRNFVESELAVDTDHGSERGND